MRHVKCQIEKEGKITGGDEMYGQSTPELFAVPALPALARRPVFLANQASVSPLHFVFTPFGLMKFYCNRVSMTSM